MTRFAKWTAAGVVAALVAVAGAYSVVMTGGGAVTPDPRGKALVALGAEVYARNCAECHGARLEGQPGWRSRNADGTLPAPPHDETGHTWHHTDQAIFDYTKKGGQALAPPGFKSAMPGFGGKLSDREIWAVIAYIKSRWPAPVLERQMAISARNR